MFPRRTTTVALALTAALLLGMSVGTGMSAMASESDCAAAADGSSSATAAVCWVPVTDSNLPPVSQSRAISIAKKHNRARGDGLRHTGAPTLLVSDIGAVAVIWALSGANVLPSSQLVVIVGRDDRAHSVEQDDFVSTADGGMIHRQWQDNKLKVTTAYTAAEIAKDAVQVPLGVQATQIKTLSGSVSAAGDDAATCVILGASIFLLTAAATVTCMLASWACFAAWAVVAGLIHRFVMNCA